MGDPKLLCKEKENMKKENYGYDLKNGNLTNTYVVELENLLRKHMTLEDIPNNLIKNSYLNENLSRLRLYIANGNKSWQGLVVGFPGNTKDMTTTNVGTPFLRIILLPILQLFEEVNQHLYNNAKCIYFLGARFSDVFIRKFKLLSPLTPHLIVLTNDLLKTIRDTPPDKIDIKEIKREALYQQLLCHAMNKSTGLDVPIDEGLINIGYISHEVQTAEGTIDPERLDILGYDKKDHSLIAFEIKGPSCGEVQFANLLLQGLEHRNWIEENKMAIKLIKEGPPKGKINTTKRVKLILGFCDEKVPELFKKYKEILKRKDKYICVYFVNMELNNNKLELHKAN
jgi:hypothetical protein